MSKSDLEEGRRCKQTRLRRSGGGKRADEGAKKQEK